MKYVHENLWLNCIGAWCPSQQRARGVSTLTDHSPFNNPGTLTNMDPGTDWVPSEGKYGIRFGDATNEHVLASNKLSNQAGTVFAFFMSESQGHTGYVVGHFNGGSRLYILWANGTITFSVGSTNPLVQLTGNFANTIYSAAGTWSGGASGSGELFVNGSPKGSAAYTGLNTFLSTIPIGNISLLNTPLIGIVYEVRFYNRVLTPSEIRTLSFRRGIAYETQRRTRAYVAGGGPAANTPQLMLLGVG